MSTSSQSEFLRRIASLLDASKTPYMLVGSLASSFHGAPRADTLNHEYIDKWVEELGLTDLWARTRELAFGGRDDTFPSDLESQTIRRKLR